MLKRVFLSCLAGLWMIFSTADTIAQGKKPSQALRQVAEQQKRSLETFDNDLASKKAQPYEWDERTEALKRYATEQAASFKIKDWKGEELLTLATLYQQADMFASAVEAYHAYLAAEPKAKKEPTIIVSLIRALTETEQLDEAEKLLEGMDWMVNSNPMVMASRVALHKDLAVALRDRGSHESAAYQARKGYTLADSINSSRDSIIPLQQAAQRDQMMLAALAISSFERIGKTKEANDLMKLVERADFQLQPALKTRYEAELTIARLIGKPAPELAVSRWLDPNGLKIADLSGRVLLLDFWAMWCNPCMASHKYWREFQSKYADKGFQVIGITRFYGRSDVEDNLSRDQEFKSLQNYKSKFNLTWPIAIGKMDDLTNEERFGINAMPTVVLIDRRGNVHYVKRGTGDYQKLAKQIERLLGEKT